MPGLWCVPAILGLLCAPVEIQAQPSMHASSFAYVGKDYVITAELAGAHSFVVNFINLSDFVTVVQPGDFIYRGASGQHYIGQVYKVKHKDPLGEMRKYSASILLKSHSFAGLEIVGLFKETDSIEEASVRIGSRRYYLQPLEKVQFEELARKIEALDLSNPDILDMFQEMNIQEMGHVESTDGTPEWDRDWEGLITDGVSPPRAIESPPVPLTGESSGAKNRKPVRVSCHITKNGGILNLKVVKGTDRDLDQTVLDWVMNHWLFLPATKNGEVYETILEFDVPFVDPSENP